MKKNLIFILLILSSFVSYSAKDSSKVVLNKGEHLFVELSDESGNTIFRKYNPDGYLDLILTTDGYVNSVVHFYEPNKIEDFKVAFVPGAGDPEYKDWVLKIYNPSRELVRGETIFGVMEKDKFAFLSSKFKDFCLVLVYKKDGVIGGNEITIGE